MQSWLTSFPKLLWQLGSDAPSATQGMLRILLAVSQRQGAEGNAALQALSRQCTPLLAAATKGQEGGSGAGAFMSLSLSAL